MTEVLLMGGGGFLGRALAMRLNALGRRIHLLTRRPVGGMPREVAVHCGGLDDASKLREVLPHCATVLHLACTTTPSVSADRPSLEIEENIAPTLRFLTVLRDFPAIHLIYLSTGGALYGNVGEKLASEGDPVAPLSNHGAGKAAIEAFLRAHADRLGSPLTVLRPSNLYGPGQTLRSGFGVIRTMLEHALNDTPLEIWGDGETVRDFLFIDDMVEVCCRFIGLPQDRGIYNVGTSQGHSLNQVRAMVERVTRRALRVTYGAPRSVDVRSIVLDAGRVRQRLQWNPLVALEAGIGATWDWLSTRRGEIAQTASDAAAR